MVCVINTSPDQTNMGLYNRKWGRNTAVVTQWLREQECTNWCFHMLLCCLFERHVLVVNVECQPRQHMQTHREISMSLNSSNPVLRWGHTSQPITIGTRIRHPSLNQSTRLWFFSPPALSFSLSSPSPFHPFWNSISWATAHPQRRKWFTICWCVPVSHFLFLLKLLSLYLFSLSATPLCATHSFTKYTIPGGNPSTSVAISAMTMSVFALDRSVSRVLILCSLERLYSCQEPCVSVSVYSSMCTDVSTV